MPIRNLGTLLENIVLVEAFRLIDEILPAGEVIDFTNAFSMSPLSPWKGHKNDTGFNADIIAGLPKLAENPGLQLYLRLLRRCAMRDLETGPSGTFLVTLAATLSGRPLRRWVNDLPDDDERQHYPGTISLLNDLDYLSEELAGRQSGQVPAMICAVPYPNSLEALRSTLMNWCEARPPIARLGFLDPMKYSVVNRDFNMTSRNDHRRWLRILRDNCGGPVVSVHFTGSQNQPLLNHELHCMFKDGASLGFDSIAFRHRTYAVAVHVRGNSHPTRNLTDRLEFAVGEAWGNWYEVVDVEPTLLTATTSRMLHG